MCEFGYLSEINFKFYRRFNRGVQKPTVNYESGTCTVPTGSSGTASATGASGFLPCGNMLEELMESKEYLINSFGNLGSDKSGDMDHS